MGVCDARTPWTEKEIHILKAMCAQGMTDEEIGKKLGRKSRNVYYIRRTRGIEKTGKTQHTGRLRAWTKEEQKMLVNMAKSGCSDAQIAASLNRTTASVQIRRRQLRTLRPTRQTLCWKCQNAVPNMHGRGCEWSRRFKPVPGWDADEEEMCMSEDPPRYDTSYFVRSCPKFLADERK